MSVRDKDATYNAKQDGGHDSSTKASTSSPRQWSSSGLKNPRIVRVSRCFGGKDRHSKVCTIKGLRDRRIRLSVPTAIQVYDLQHRLGLSQPSKVIDWLLDATKHDIDKLPPLPITPTTFAPQQTTSSFSRKEAGINSDIVDDEEDQSLITKLKYWDSNLTILRSKQKGVFDERPGTNFQVSAQNLFPISSSSPASTTLLSSNTSSNNNDNDNPMFNYYHWEPSSDLSLTQLGSSSLSLPSHNSSGTLPSSLSSSSSGSQLFLYPSIATSSLFPQHHHHHHHHQVAENDSRQFNRFQYLSNNNYFSSSFHNPSGGLGLKAFPFSMNHHQLNHLQLNNEETNHNQDKSNHDPWKE